MGSVIEFSRPATAWLECLPLGNGSVGAMLDGAPGTTEIRLNDETAWSGSPRNELALGEVPASVAAEQVGRARDEIAAGHPSVAEEHLRKLQVPYSQAFLPFATLLLSREARTTGPYRRRLDLESGIHDLTAGELGEQTFVSAVHGVLLHRITGAHDVRAAFRTPHHVIGSYDEGDDLTLVFRLPSDVAPGHEPQRPAATWSDDPTASLAGAVSVGIRRDAVGVVVAVATETTFAGLGNEPEQDPLMAAARARSRVDAALHDGWDAVLAAHEEEFTHAMGAARIDLGDAPVGADGTPRPTDERLAAAESDPRGPLAADPALAALLFDYGRYLLASSSRPGTLPATLQGIWNDEMQPPWSSNYTLNINLQMNYWAAYGAGMASATEPLLDFISALAVAGAPTAARLYGADGWVAHHNSDPWLVTNPVGDGHGDARWAYWPIGSLWLVTHIVDGADFGAIGHERLIGLWPAVRGAAAFALNWTTQGEDGRWRTSPATSPENAYLLAGEPVAVDETTAMDLTLVRAACSGAARIADRLGITDDDVAERARDLAHRLPPEPGITADGMIREWAHDRVEEDPHHRHVSHLVGLYPGTTPWSPEARAAAEESLRRRGDDSSGWSLVWKGLLWARLGRGDRAEALMRLLFRSPDHLDGPWAGGLYANLFASHPPFQIDANLGFPALMIETLLQSHDGIEFLPALPPALASGSARGLVARPGITVDLSWREGRLIEARLVSRYRTPVSGVRLRWGGVEIIRDLSADGELVVSADDFRPDTGGTGAP